MDGNSDRANYENQTGKYLRRVDDTYVFDAASGLYKPKTYQEKDKVNEQISHQKFDEPVVVQVDRPVAINIPPIGPLEVGVRAPIQVDLEEPVLIDFHDRALATVKIKTDFFQMLFTLVNAFLATATVILLIATVHFAKKQWEEADRTARSSVTAADAAKSSADTARQTLFSVQRARVSFLGYPSLVDKDTKDGKINNLIVTLSWMNSGDTPTTKAVSQINFNMFPPDGISDRFKFRDLKLLTKQSQFAISPRGSGNATETIPIGDFIAAQGGYQRLYTWGWITYHDIFEGTPTHLSEFCDEVTRIKSSTSDMSDPSSVISFQLALCPHHNCDDQECTDYKEKTRDR